MSRRRRLALRQIEESAITAALSDLDDEHKPDEGAAEPNFSLLGMMQVEEPAPQASTPPVIYVDEDDVDDAMGESLTQAMESSSDRKGNPAKKPRLQSSSASRSALVERPTSNEEMTATLPLSDTPRGVFQLYQQGLCADHTLRLHYIRQRPPPPPVKRVEEKFVLPRPRLNLLDLIPPQSISITDVLSIREVTDEGVSALPTQSESRRSLEDVKAMLESATVHWRQLETTPDEIVLSWRSLQECEWYQVLESNRFIVPRIDDLIRLLQELRSDAFASIVWRELLVPTLKSLPSEGTAAVLAKVSELANVLFNHAHFQHLPAKDFRAQLRGKNLRAIHASVGAASELILVTHFHKFRKTRVYY